MFSSLQNRPRLIPNCLHSLHFWMRRWKFQVTHFARMLRFLKLGGISSVVDWSLLLKVNLRIGVFEFWRSSVLNDEVGVLGSWRRHSKRSGDASLGLVLLHRAWEWHLFIKWLLILISSLFLWEEPMLDLQSCSIQDIYIEFVSSTKSSTHF